MLIELQYLPPVSWLALVAANPKITLETHENFQKGTYRNRCHIAAPNGIQRLSIPLKKGKHQQTPIREVEISYAENWQQQHWRSITAAYGRAPFFEHFAPAFEPFFQEKFDLLFDFNFEILQVLLQKMGLPAELQFSEKFETRGAAEDFRDLISPKNLKPPALFLTRKYGQVFAERHGFLSDLSGLDLLFCCGRNWKEILEPSLLNTLNT